MAPTSAMTPVADPDLESGGQEINGDEVEQAINELDEVRRILEDLRSWKNWETRRRQSLRSYLLSKIFPIRPPCPPPNELRRLARFFFPPRASLRATVCDYGEGRFERREVKTIKRSFFASSAVRQTQAQQVTYEKAGPSLACEVMTLRDKQYLQDQLDVFNMLREDHDLTNTLDKENRMYASESSLNEDISRLAGEFSIGNDFWQLCTSDIPWQLGEGTRFSLLETDLGTNAVSLTIKEQSLSRHPRYANSVLVRALLQCYHREDGYVLTMSPTAGVSFLDRTFLQDIQILASTRAEKGTSSFLGHYMEKYKGSGTGTWPVKTPEWFIVDLLSRLSRTPHALFAGRAVPDIQNTYLPLLRDLQSRSEGDFIRHESINLVREYIACMDEVSQIHSISERKIDFLERLKNDFKTSEETSDEGSNEEQTDFAPPKPSADDRARDLMIRKIEKAISHITAHHEGLPGTLRELRNCLDDLFQLRTIEQNELAIIAESNNKAILVFTVVTIVFLPLSFFTSYYGMNFKGNYNLLPGQGYFWAVCGSVTAVIVVFTLAYGFKDRLYVWIWGNKRASLTQEYRYKRR
ncbi:hypothetical protein ACLMJK_008667 [Lecanora helva]